ncbi:MAG: carbon-nitrogen hydrolase family protein [Deltaproteobacteria bacterium]|nr:MAG: carbon-nitrogen hydrolase family protein [Deltaproteobacteria bacterium]
MTRVALVAVQMRVTADDLASPAAFAAWVDRHAAAAAGACAGADHRLVVFPENVGALAMLAFAPARARRMATVDRAIAVLAASRPWALARAALDHGTLSPRRAALLALAPPAADLARAAFSRAARRLRATVVGGSYLRAAPGGKLFNSSDTFDPSGRRVATTAKVNLVPGLEDASPTGLGLARGDADAVPIVRTEWGSVATLICYDGFCEPHTRGERFAAVGPRVDAAGCDVIANPAANPWPWDAPWVFAEPGERLLRRDQWRREGLAATLAGLHRARFGVTAHLVGRVLDRAFEGPSEILERTGGGVRVLARAERADAAAVVAAVVDAGEVAVARAGRAGGGYTP